MKQKLALVLGLILMAPNLSACSGRNQLSENISETFIAIELEASDSNLSIKNQMLYTIEGGEIIPSFRLGISDNLIIVYPEFGAYTQSFSGFAELPDGKIGYLSQKDGTSQVLSIDKKTGDKTRLFSSKDLITSVEYFIKQEVFVINTVNPLLQSKYGTSDGYCYVLAVNSESQRVGTGRCKSTKDRLWLITSNGDGMRAAGGGGFTTLSELNSKFEVLGRQSLPAEEIILSHSGKLAIGESSKTGTLNVYSIASGDTLWSSSETDLAAELLTVAESSDSFIIGIDADDEDGLVDLVWFRLEGDKLVSELLGDAQSASVRLSELGDFAVAEIKGLGDSPPRLLAATFGSEIKIYDLGASTVSVLIEPNIVAFVDDEVLYLSIAGDEPSRAMDVYGVINRISKATSGTILVMTQDDDDYLLTIITPDGSRWQSREIFAGIGRPSIVDARGDSVLIRSSEDDGYVTLYNLDLSGEPKSEKLAEGNIKVANFGPDDLVYFADVTGDSIDVLSIKPGDRDSRKRVSSRYTVDRYGQFGLKEAKWLSDSPTITAVVDRLLAYCKSQGLPILLAAGGSATVTVDRTENLDEVASSAKVCVRIRSKDVGKEISISATSGEDVAIIWDEFNLSDGDQPSTMNDVRTESADDQASMTDPFLSIESTDRSALVSVVSWGETASVEIGVGLQAKAGTSSSEFDYQRYNAHNVAREKCIGHAVIDGTKTLRVKVGVYPSGQTGETPFCVRLSGLEDGPRRLVMNPIETGDVAALTVECADDESYFKKSFQSDRPSSEDYEYGYSFSSRLKGLVGQCQLRHYREYPDDYNWGTWGEVDFSLQS